MAASIHSHKKDTREQKRATSPDAVPRASSQDNPARPIRRWRIGLVVAGGAHGRCRIGLLILQPDAIAMNLLGRIWPVALVALAAWMTVQARRSLRSLGRPVVLYPPSRTA